MAKMPAFIRQLLRQTEATEEATIVRDDNPNNEAGSLESTGDDAQNRGSESFWQTVTGAGEASEGTRADERSQAEAQMVDDAGDQAAVNPMPRQA